MIHIGEKIKEVAKKKGITIVDFASKINCSRRNIYSIFNKPTIDTGLLLKISKVLEYNFFEYYNTVLSASYKIESSVDVFNEPWEDMVEYKNKNSKNKEKIEELIKEIEYLKEINQLLKK